MDIQALLDLFKDRAVRFFLYTPTRWHFLLACLVLALITFAVANRRRNTTLGIRAFLSFLFPSALYRHRSSLVELRYLLTVPVIAGLFFMPALAITTSDATRRGMQQGLTTVLGEHGASLPGSGFTRWVMLAVFTVLAAAAADFGFFLHHYFAHKVPFLWEFHKVHHSAEVLTPLTDFRLHPLELLTFSAATGIGLGSVQGIFSYAMNEELAVLTVLGFNVVIFAYYSAGYVFRHSHLWISYGPILNRVFISPAQHQIHHSDAAKHWDKNFGGTFALWDALFGTLYVPKEREELTVGLGQEGEEFLTVSSLYVRPFRQNLDRPIGRWVVVVFLCVCVVVSVVFHGRVLGFFGS